MKIIVTDRHFIESGIVVRHPYVVISISDPDKPKPVIPRRCGLKAVFHTAFHDAEPVEKQPLPSGIVLMTLGQADAIWMFVKEHQEEIGCIVCHCEQGMSRSPAVALALAEAFRIDTRKIKADYQPNPYVYRLMIEAIKETPRTEFHVTPPSASSPRRIGCTSSHRHTVLDARINTPGR